MKKKHNFPSRPRAGGGREYEVEPGKWVTRQRAWQLLRRALKRCRQCGKECTTSSYFCDGCLEKHRARVNRRRRRLKQPLIKPWEPGKPGRPLGSGEDERFFNLKKIAKAYR